MELFDGHNRFNFPSKAEIAALPPEARKRFESVAAAKNKLEAAIKHRVAIEHRIEAVDKERAEVDAEIVRLRPKWTFVDNVKAHIASERAQRLRERGLA